MPMTPGEALEVVAEEVTCEVLREMIDNGLVATYVDHDLDERSAGALLSRLEQRIAARPGPGSLTSAWAALAAKG
jgi:hypothetical protein